MSLPILSDEAKQHPDCCSSLSKPLIETLTSLFVKHAQPGFVLSVGSGSGLLETLIVHSLEQRRIQDLWIEGVEVPAPAGQLNSYLPEEFTNTVDGTWGLCERADKASALMFVYPRTPNLIQQYIQSAVQCTSGIRLIVWLGPRADWDDFEPCFLPHNFGHIQHLTGCGLSDYERMVAMIRRPN